MAMPAYIATGTASEFITTGAIAWPTHAAGDFALLCISHPGTVQTTPTGWDLVVAVISNANSCRLTVFSKFATSSSETNPTCVGSADINWGVITTYSGVNTITPTHGVGPSWGTGLGEQIAGGSTLINNCLIVTALSWDVDGAGPYYSSPTNAALSSLTERADGGTATGTGSGIAIWDGGLATAGAFGPTQVTVGSATGAFSSATIALVASDRTLDFSNKSQIVNFR